MDASFIVSKAVIVSYVPGGLVKNERGCLFVCEDENSTGGGLWLHYADRAALARFARLLCGLAGVEVPAEVEPGEIPVLQPITVHPVGLSAPEFAEVNDET